MTLRLAAVTISLFTSLPAAAESWIETSDAHTQKVLEAQAAFVPEGAAGLGLDQFDGDILDLKADLYERSQATNRELVAQVDAALATAEHPKVRQDLEILRRSLLDGIESAELQHQYLLPYFNLPQTLFFGFRSLLDPRTDPARYPAALERLSKYTGQAQGYKPITDLARARTTERLDEPGLVAPFRGEVERDLDNAQRYIAGLDEVFASVELDGYEEDLALLQSQLRDYAEWVRETVLPIAREDNRLPEAIYADNLKNFGVRATPEELIETAQFGYQEIRSTMRALAEDIATARGWEDDDLVAVMARLKQDQISEEEILDVYRQRLEVIEEIIEREQIVTLPQRDAVIRLATEAESSAIPAPFMSPPQLIGNTGQYGEFVLVASNPTVEGDAKMDDWTHDAITWALTVHEARPGHEMQFASLVENGTSMARAIYAFNSANVEGWGLYAEALMYEHLPPEGQLFTLMTRLQRAVRMFLDPMVNTGQITPEETVEFMIEQVGLSRAMAQSEADRYAFIAPGQATSYYYGYMNLMRLRTEVELALGEAFNQKAFHDFVLAQGLLPPELLRQAVLEEFMPQHQPVAAAP